MPSQWVYSCKVSFTFRNPRRRLGSTDEVGEIVIAKGDALTVIQPNQDQNSKYWLNSSIITEFEIRLA